MTDEKLACVTLDLENDWYFDEDGYDHLTFEYIDDYIKMIQELDIPITFFAVGKTIERFPDVIDKLDEQLDCEFHLHSYQHDTSKSYDFRTEIQNGKKAFESHFGYEPAGYRAPQGNIEPHEFKILEDEGFQFDSSVFPSYRPGIYSNLDKPLSPYQPGEVEELVEIPIAATPRTRIPICQSYLKLLGRPYHTYLKYAPLPDPLVFNTHLQDFYQTDSHNQLDQPKQSIMKRNLNRSVNIFSMIIEQFQNRRYSFEKMTDIGEVPTENSSESPIDKPKEDSQLVDKESDQADTSINSD
ncbi:polysaccharide deacetylase family protein [Natronoglomus mannanivorans]|uniref:Polysaccharide deacetylase family protein n=1 Tax=Natronoglomus mannanivorans TaxID=2979990 RepID=A0AAP3E381_9EURY|nr:polysaccharide deacetylase family protein [Halobacteria archaeon AArc-xg1-1]